jgi:hypothetical protein
MKKVLLIAFLVIPGILLAQQAPYSNQSSSDANIIYTPEMDLASDQIFPIGPQLENPNSGLKTKAQNYSFVKIGETFYDLQTNSSPGRRVLLHDDGTISAVWTNSAATSTTWPDRGTGFSHYDGSAWSGIPSARIETSARTGWPSISLLGNGNEAVIAHESNTGGFIMTTNTGAGTTNWTSTTAILDDLTTNDNRVPIWNRSVASGNYIHLISNYWFSTASNVPLVTRNGVTSPTTYSRSLDNGVTWDTAHMLLPGYDSTLYTSGGGDNYAIDARDSTVAIVMGGVLDPVSLWKSTDNGETWTYFDVDSMPFKGPTQSVDLFASGDTMFNINDGSLDVIIDNDGEVHVFYGSTFGYAGIDQASGDTVTYFNLLGSGLVHWSESKEPQVVGYALDRDGDDEITIATETYLGLDNGAMPGNGTYLQAARYGQTTIVTMPSAAIDTSGNLYLVFSSAQELVTHELGANLRDIMVVASSDDGATWSVPQNITTRDGQECTFPNVAKRADDFIHLIYQMDPLPGTNLQNHDPNYNSHPNFANDIMYGAIPTDDILNDVIGQHGAGVDEVEGGAKVLVVGQNQPNPFTNLSTVTVYLQSGSETTLTVMDVLGNVVNEGSLGVLGAGTHAISLDGSSLSSGIYYYTISTKDHSVTKKMQVQ